MLFDWAFANCYRDNLTFYYRSKNSKLIEFSNKHFYGNDLEVFRKPIENNNAIVIINADGFWADNKNLIEARETIKLVVKLQKKYPEKSVAIITFNIHQKNLINELIEGNERLKANIDRNNEHYHNKIGKNEPLIVRNIENIQGDERDIIIFNTTYARYENNRTKIVANYGSLSRQGGENRLNVALTRSRDKIYVIKSIYGKDFYGKKSESRGTKIFWEWIDYLDTYGEINEKEKDIVAHDKRDLNYFEELFASDFGKYLANHNQFRLDSQIELGKYSGKNYRLDFAIYDKLNKQYVLAIELDGKQYHYNSLGQFKKQDIDRQIFIENMGWKFVRFNYDQYTSNSQQCWNIIATEILNNRKLHN